MTNAELRDQLESEHGLAFGWALACCKGDQHEAEDVLQDSYLAVLNGAARYEARSSFRTWLFGVIRLKAISARRKTIMRAILLQKRNGTSEELHVMQPGTDYETERTGLRLQAALNRLSERQRQVLHLVFYQEMTVEEAAKIMGISVGSARTHYARGKEGLARMLGTRSDE